MTYKLFLTVITFILYFENIQPNLILPKRVSEVVLCRNCGHGISSNRDIFSKHSTKSYHQFNDSLFNKDNVLVEVFLTEFFLHYPVLAFYDSECVGVGEWDEDASLYPGYRWKPCICPECGAYIGWAFELIHPDSVEPPKKFYGLILNSLISETCKYNYFKYCVSLKFSFELPDYVSRGFDKLEMAADTISAEDQEFLAMCEEELKDRYTEKDDDFMTIFNSEPSKPPVVESWWVPNYSGRRNDRHNRRHHPYERHGRDSDHHDRRGNRSHRGYNDYSRSDGDRAQGYRPQRPRY